MKKNKKSSGWIALRPVVWLVAVLMSAVVPGALFVALPVAVIYTIACVFIGPADKEKRAVEIFREDSFIVSYLEGTFADIDHINSISGSDGLRFDSAQIKLEPHGYGGVYDSGKKSYCFFEAISRAGRCVSFMQRGKESGGVEKGTYAALAKGRYRVQPGMPTFF